MHNYISLVKFLIEPLLDHPEALKVDCEISAKGDRVMVRVAFEGAEKGRIFGRNGRTIQSIRTLLSTAANAYDQTIRFDVFDPDSDFKSIPNPKVITNIEKPKPKLKHESNLELI